MDGLTTRARSGVWFRVAPRSLFKRSGDVSLSAAFGREYVVDVPGHGPEAGLAVTRALAPDVQELLVRYGDADRLDLTFTSAGVLARCAELRAVLSEAGHHDSEEGRRFVAALFRCLHVVHEVFEQLDPAYKLDATKAAVLRRVGLAAPA